jgi:hypothetical protein
MFGWLKQRLINWADRYQKREIERLYVESLRLKAEVLKTTGEERIRLTPEECLSLNELRKKLDPEVLKRIDVLFDAE